MNIEQRITNSEVTTSAISFEERKLQDSGFNVKYLEPNFSSWEWMKVWTGIGSGFNILLAMLSLNKLFVVAKSFRAVWVILFALLINGYSIQGQSFQKIYSGLDNATSLYVTQGEIYIVEQGKDRLLKLHNSGKLNDTIGGKGSGNYQFSRPVDVDATNSLKIFVTDYNNRRVQVFDKRGQYLSSISASDAFGNNRPYNPTQISVNGLGEVFFVNEAENYIHRFDLDSNLLDEFRIPGEVKGINELIVTSGEILILDINLQTIHRLALNGSYQGFYPAEGVMALFVDEQGMWKAFSNRIEFENQAKEKRTFHYDQEIQPIDLQVIDRAIFILTKQELFQISAAE